MLLPLDVRATMLATSLDVIAAEIRGTGSSTAPSAMLEGVLADAQASARALAAELSPSYALAQAVGDTLRASLPVATRETGSNVVPFRARTR